MRILLFLIKFKLNIYTNVDDYNKIVLSKNKLRKSLKWSCFPPNYSGETMTLLVYDFLGLIYKDIIVML